MTGSGVESDLPGETDAVHTARMLAFMQEYRPDVWRVWSNGQWVQYNLQGETEAVRTERLWSEATLQAQRRNNTRCVAQMLQLLAQWLCLDVKSVSSPYTMPWYRTRLYGML